MFPILSSDTKHCSNQTNKVVAQIKTDSAKASLHESFSEIFGCEKSVDEAQCPVDPQASNTEDQKLETVLDVPLQDSINVEEEAMERQLALIER